MSDETNKPVETVEDDPVSRIMAHAIVILLFSFLGLFQFVSMYYFYVINLEVTVVAVVLGTCLWVFSAVMSWKSEEERFWSNLVTSVVAGVSVAALFSVDYFFIAPMLNLSLLLTLMMFALYTLIFGD